MPALSVCCLTADPGPRVAAALRPLRGIADEIVVAADSRAQAGSLREYAAIADRVVRVDYEPPFERYLAWLHGLCTGDWILRLDGDEVPSRALIDALPSLVTRRDVLQFHLPRRWVHPDAAHWLDEWPWTPDHHPRLVRRDEAVWFPGLLHSGAAHVFPAEYLELPIYHLDPIVSARPAREAKTTRYLGTPSALAAPAADELVERYYLPEVHASLEPAEVPAADRPLIDAVLSARETPGEGVLEDASPAVAVADVDRTWARRELDAGAYRATLAPIDGHRRLTVAEHRPFRLAVTNHGTERWPGGDRDPLIRVAYRWLDPAGEVVVETGFRSAFGSSIGPGETSAISAIVAAPDRPGDHLLEFDLVHEFVRWFGATLRIGMAVVPAVAEPPRP